VHDPVRAPAGAILTLVLSGRLGPGQVAIYYLSEGRAERLEANERGQVAGDLRGPSKPTKTS